MTRRIAILLAALVAPLAWTLDRPADFDEVNFLTLARGAALDPWRPHAISINWQGVTEPAFAVLSNPPGIAWWLWPVVAQPVWVQRVWMLPWLVLAAFGAGKLGKRFLGSGEGGALVLLTAPVVVLASTALLPDLPLYACCLAGMGAFIEAIDEDEPAFGWAALLGVAALFRYSGLALWPLPFLYAFLQRRSLWFAVPVVVPTVALALHDAAAYGQIHLLAAGQFQSVSNTPLDWGHKAAAAVTFLGGVVVLPVYRWQRAGWTGAALGAVGAAYWGPVAAGFGALGGASLAVAVGALRGQRGGAAEAPAEHGNAAPDRLFLAAWSLLGLAFLLTLRFTAARYWLPFAPGLLLLLPQDLPRLRLGLSFGLGVLLSVDVALQARGDADLASRAAAVAAPAELAAKPGFVGHWGWQGRLEAAGWTALDEGVTAAPGSLVAIPVEAWPQAVGVRCDHVRWRGSAWPPIPWLPRGYSREAEANLNANWIAGKPPVRIVVPWWFARDAYESARVCAE